MPSVRLWTQARDRGNLWSDRARHLPQWRKRLLHPPGKDTGAQRRDDGRQLAGEWQVAEGGCVRDKEHGLQFKAAVMTYSDVFTEIERGQDALVCPSDGDPH